MATKQSARKRPSKSKTVRVVRPRRSSPTSETDSAFFLKLVMYFIFGTLWIHISRDDWTMPLPIGFLVGMAFATHDHFQIDRKIEYAVLVVAMFVTYFLAPRLSILL